MVADNDEALSAKHVVENFAKSSTFETKYVVEPERNIALARNRALAAASTDLIAWLDDDELPSTCWLNNLLHTCTISNAAGVLGPVRPYFSESPPTWLIKGRFCERPEYPTGTPMHWSHSRTGNLLFRKEILKTELHAFDPRFSTGGEDIDFFRRMAAHGHVFVWCNEAAVHELVPRTRWSRRFLLTRALLRGQNTYNQRGQHAAPLLKSAAAVPMYSIALPAAAFVGQHALMKVAIKLCDHLGRILAMLHLNPVKQRPM